MRKFSVQDLTLAAPPGGGVRHPHPWSCPSPPSPASRSVCPRPLPFCPSSFRRLPPGLFVGASWPTCFPLSAGHRVRLRRHPSGLPDDPADAQPLAGSPSPVLSTPPSWGRRSPGLRRASAPASGHSYAFNALTVGLGELLACYLLGSLLLSALPPRLLLPRPSFRPTAWTGWPPTPESASALTAPDGWTPGASGPGLSGSFLFLLHRSFTYLSSYCIMGSHSGGQLNRHSTFEIGGLSDMKFHLVTGDITTLEVDAIVNAANTSPAGRRRSGRGHPPGSRSGAVGRVPHPPRLSHRPGQGDEGLPPSGQIRHPYSRPVWHGGGRGAGAAGLLLPHLPGPVSGAALPHGGLPRHQHRVYHYPPQEAAAIAVAECRRFLTEHPDGPEITFVCFSSHMAAIYRQLLDQETEQM